MFTFISHFEKNKILQRQNCFIINSHRVSSRAVRISSRAVRISSRAVRVFPTLSLRRVRPSYGTFFLMVFQENCAQGRTGHMITCFIYQADLDLISVNQFIGLLKFNTFTATSIKCERHLTQCLGEGQGITYNELA